MIILGVIPKAGDIINIPVKSRKFEKKLDIIEYDGQLYVNDKYIYNGKELRPILVISADKDIINGLEILGSEPGTLPSFYGFQNHFFKIPFNIKEYGNKDSYINPFNTRQCRNLCSTFKWPISWKTLKLVNGNKIRIPSKISDFSNRTFNINMYDDKDTALVEMRYPFTKLATISPELLKEVKTFCIAFNKVFHVDINDQTDSKTLTKIQAWLDKLDARKSK